MEQIDYQFLWEGTGNPNDPSGVATFRVGRESVRIGMRSLAQAATLDRLVQEACYRTRQRVIDRATIGITDLLKEYRYG